MITSVREAATLLLIAYVMAVGVILLAAGPTLAADVIAGTEERLAAWVEPTAGATSNQVRS